jgi:hypothetical protein
MVAGIPGAGIGGLFYLLSAFSLPLRLVRRWWRGERRPVAGDGTWRQVGMALGIVGGIWLTGWMLGLIVMHGGMGRAPAVIGIHRFPGASANVIRAATLLGGFVTLTLVLVTVELGRLLVTPSRIRRSSNDTFSRHWQ